jgi:hypothetical protein
MSAETTRQRQCADTLCQQHRGVCPAELLAGPEQWARLTGKLAARGRAVS